MLYDFLFIFRQDAPLVEFLQFCQTKIEATGTPPLLVRSIEKVRTIITNIVVKWTLSNIIESFEIFLIR